MKTQSPEKERLITKKINNKKINHWSSLGILWQSRRVGSGCTNSFSLLTAVMQAQHTQSGLASNYARAHNSFFYCWISHQKSPISNLRTVLKTSSNATQAHNLRQSLRISDLLLQLGIFFSAMSLCLTLTFPERK